MLVFIIKVNAQSPNWTWVNSNGGTDYDWGQSVASDAIGNTVVVGAFYSPTIVFGSTVLTNPNAGKYTSFFVRYDINGNVIWAKQPITVGGTHYNRATGVSIDNLNNIYITGVYNATTITFDTITLTKTHCCFSACYLIKYDPAGNIIWAKTTIGEQTGTAAYPPQPTSEPTPLNKIAINKNNGDLYLAGTFDIDTMYFESTALINATLDTGFVPRRDVFIAKYNSSGNFIWAKSIGGQRQDYASDISVKDASLFITGSFSSSTIQIGATTLSNLNQGSNWDRYLPFIAKYDTSGNPLWAKQGNATLTGLNTALGKSVAADINGNCYITGEFRSPFIVFNSDTLHNTDTTIGFSKIFVVKYNSSGNLIWSKTFAHGSGPDWSMDIQTDTLGNVYIGGCNWSNSLLIDTLVFTSYSKVFIAKLNSSGIVQWAKAPGGSGGTNKWKYIIGLNVSDLGNINITGSFMVDIHFDSNILLSNGLSDIFTATILNCAPSNSIITSQGNTTFCQGDSVILSAAFGYISYQWYRSNYAIPGATSMTYTAKSGGKYHCKSQNAMLCSDTSNIIVVNVPCISIGPNQERSIINMEYELEPFEISPNPGSGVFSIISPGGQIQIFNSFGKLILSKDIATGKASIDISSNSNGIYLVTLLKGNTRLSQKLILMK